MDEITIIILTKNEEGNIEWVINELNECGFNKILVADANSSDKTIEIVKKKGVNFFIQKKNGYGAAIIEAIEHVNTKYLSIIDADGSYDSRDIPKMFKILKSQNLDFVLGSRYLGGNKSDDDTFVRLVGNKFFTYISQVLFKFEITDILFHFPVCKTQYYKNLNLQFDDFSICVEVPVKVHYNKYSYTEFFSKERARLTGVSKVNAFTDGIKILLKIIRLYLILRKKN